MVLDRLVGTWDLTMQHVAMPGPVLGQQRYERVLDDAFVLLRCTYEHPDFPDSLALLTASACHYFDTRGVSRVFDVEVDGTGWTMVRRDPDFWQRSTSTLVGAASLRGTGENSHDGGATWQHDFSISCTRVG